MRQGRAAPELVYSKDRLTMPLRRTRPKGDADPGWVEISWEQALDETASALRRIAHAHGPESIVFGQSSPSTTAIADSAPYVRRLMHALGTPNMAWALDMCGWSRGLMHDTSLPGTALACRRCPLNTDQRWRSIVVW